MSKYEDQADQLLKLKESEELVIGECNWARLDTDFKVCARLSVERGDPDDGFVYVVSLCGWTRSGQRLPQNSKIWTKDTT
jgi:hypothetical protein